MKNNNDTIYEIATQVCSNEITDYMDILKDELELDEDIFSDHDADYLAKRIVDALFKAGALNKEESC